MNKNISNFTFKDMYETCPFKNGEPENISDKLVIDFCDNCKYSDVCALPPSEWSEDIRRMFEAPLLNNTPDTYESCTFIVEKGGVVNVYN